MFSRKIDRIFKLASLFEKMAMGGGYYVVFSKGTTADFYGPFIDEDAAKKSSYFGQSVEVNDQSIKTHYYPFHVSSYDENEIAAFKNDPAEITNGETTKVNFHPPHIPMHPSWKEFFQGGTFTPEQWWQGKLDGRW